jgi:hypothetical protein
LDKSEESKKKMLFKTGSTLDTGILKQILGRN